MTRIRLYGVALSALALACVDSQAPQDSPTTPSIDPGTSLPVMETMRVTAPTAAANGGAFTITLRFINPPTASQRAAFETAAAKWQAIIVGDVPDADGTIPQSACGNSFATPSFKGTVDDVLIDALLQPIDGPGAVLGAAGPCLIRKEDNLTLYGIMFFDTDDIASLEQNKIIDEVIVHEMGHVLGFGTLWSFRRSLLQGTTADPRFVGPNAVAGYQAVGGRGNSIPVEEGGGSGTRFSHWDEATFNTELMTGFIGLGQSPLSVMTIGSMADLGYLVDNAAADSYRVPGPQERAATEETAEFRVNMAARERLLRPVGVVE